MTLDFAPFLAAAKLLYDGPWVAERYHLAGALIERQPDAVLAVIRDVLQNAPAATAVAAFDAQYKLQRYKAECDAMMADLDCVLIPTYPRPVSLAELADEPVKSNSALGIYTNFMNLLDYAAVAVPVGEMNNGLPSGVTLFGRAFTDQYLLSLADALQRHTKLTLPGNRAMMDDAPTCTATHDRLRIVVCGAHMDGLALNVQLRERGARLVDATTSAPHYRLYALADGKRPGMVRWQTRGRTGRSLGATAQRSGVVSRRDPRTSGAGKNRAAGWTVVDRVYLRGVWPGGGTGYHRIWWLESLACPETVSKPGAGVSGTAFFPRPE